MFESIGGGYIVGATCVIIGLIVRVSAYKWTYAGGYDSSARASSGFIFWLHTYSDVGMTILVFGLAVLLVSFNARLRGLPNIAKNREPVVEGKG